MIRLCSTSETRAKILETFDISFIQSPTFFEEDSIETKTPLSFVYQVAIGKYKESLKRFDLEFPILCADTIVVANNEILRKPKDENCALELIKIQSGNIVSIITAMIYRSSKLEFIDISSTQYIFYEFEIKDVDDYIKSGQWRGKAGACMVEGFCKKYIRSVLGFESCAMGLSIEKLLPFL